MTYREFLLMAKEANTYPQYALQQGDNPSVLDKRFGFKQGTIASLNPGLDYRRLQIGQKLNMPIGWAPNSKHPATAVQQTATGTTNQYAEHYNDPELLKFYDAITQAETGSEKDPWIRTRFAPPKGSTAYGPVQITGTKARSYFKRFPKLMAGSLDFYKNILSPMHDNFAYYGREPKRPGYDRRWDYGGYGQHLTTEQKAAYKRLGLDMMRADIAEANRLLPNGTPEQLQEMRIRLWRGKTRQQDPRYFNSVNSYLSR